MLNKFSTKLSLKLFSQRKPLELVIFDKLFNKFLINIKNAKEYILKYHEDGFVKIKPEINEEIKIINDNLELEQDQSIPPYKFKINKDIHDAIHNIIYVKMKDHFMI